VLEHACARCAEAEGRTEPRERPALVANAWSAAIWSCVTSPT